MIDKINFGKIYFLIGQGIIQLKNILLAIFIMTIFITGCHSDDNINVDLDSGRFSGTFKSDTDIGSDHDSVFLEISNGYYYCYTNVPYNYGAGKIDISDTRLDFIDTLFFPIPALYISGFAISGVCDYQYDGKNLIIEKDMKSSRLIYELIKDD